MWHAPGSSIRKTEQVCVSCVEHTLCTYEAVGVSLFKKAKARRILEKIILSFASATSSIEKITKTMALCALPF